LVSIFAKKDDRGLDDQPLVGSPRYCGGQEQGILFLSESAFSFIDCGSSPIGSISKLDLVSIFAIKIDRDLGMKCREKTDCNKQVKLSRAFLYQIYTLCYVFFPTIRAIKFTGEKHEKDNHLFIDIDFGVEPGGLLGWIVFHAN
jgi:hypothetical protein